MTAPGARGPRRRVRRWRIPFLGSAFFSLMAAGDIVPAVLSAPHVPSGRAMVRWRWQSARRSTRTVGWSRSRPAPTRSPKAGSTPPPEPRLPRTRGRWQRSERSEPRPAGPEPGRRPRRNTQRRPARLDDRAWSQLYSDAFLPRHRPRPHPRDRRLPPCDPERHGERHPHDHARAATTAAPDAPSRQLAVEVAIERLRRRRRTRGARTRLGEALRVDGRGGNAVLRAD